MFDDGGDILIEARGKGIDVYPIQKPGQVHKWAQRVMARSCHPKVLVVNSPAF